MRAVMYLLTFLKKLVDIISRDDSNLAIHNFLTRNVLFYVKIAYFGLLTLFLLKKIKDNFGFYYNIRLLFSGLNFTVSVIIIITLV